MLVISSNPKFSARNPRHNSVIGVPLSEDTWSPSFRGHVFSCCWTVAHVADVTGKWSSPSQRGRRLVLGWPDFCILMTFARYMCSQVFDSPWSKKKKKKKKDCTQKKNLCINCFCSYYLTKKHTKHINLPSITQKVHVLIFLLSPFK